VKTLVDFPTFQSYVDAAEHGQTDMGDGERASRRVGDVRWSGTNDFPAAVRLARLGWPEGTAKARVLTEAALDRLASVILRDDWQHCPEGGRGELDVERYLAGDPECIIAPTVIEETTVNRAVHIVASGAASAGVDAEAIIARGAAVAALTELLTLAGYHVKVTLSTAVKGSGWGGGDSSDFESRCTIKEYTESLDLARLVFAVAHPSTLRRHHFSLHEQQTPGIRRATGCPDGYGVPTDCPTEKQGDIYLGRMLHGERNWNDVPTTLRWCLDQLRAQGVRVEGT